MERDADRHAVASVLLPESVLHLLSSLFGMSPHSLCGSWLHTTLLQLEEVWSSHNPALGCSDVVGPHVDLHPAVGCSTDAMHLVGEFRGRLCLFFFFGGLYLTMLLKDRTTQVQTYGRVSDSFWRVVDDLYYGLFGKDWLNEH